MDEEEKELLYGITKFTANLVGATDGSKGWFDHVLSDLKHQGAEDQLLHKVEEEKTHFKQILEYCDQALHDNRPLDEEHLEKMFFEERDSHKLIKQITERAENGELKKAGKKGLQHIDVVGNLTIALHEYRKMKTSKKVKINRDRKIETDNAVYLLNFQRKNDPINFNSDWFKRSDIAAVSFNQMPLNTDKLKKIINSDKPSSNSQRVFIWAKKEEKQVIIPGANKSEYYNTELADYREELSKKIANSMALAKYGILLTGPTQLGLLSLTIYAAVSMAEYGLYIGRYCHMLGPEWFKSAIIAEKMEYYASQNNKPVIYSNLPMSEYGVINFLENPELRRFVIALHSQADYLGLNPKELDTIKQINLSTSETRNLKTPTIQDIASNYNLEKTMRQAAQNRLR